MSVRHVTAAIRELLLRYLPDGLGFRSGPTYMPNTVVEVLSSPPLRTPSSSGWASTADVLDQVPEPAPIPFTFTVCNIERGPVIFPFEVREFVILGDRLQAHRQLEARKRSKLFQNE